MQSPNWCKIQPSRNPWTFHTDVFAISGVNETSAFVGFSAFLWSVSVKWYFGVVFLFSSVFLFDDYWYNVVTF